MPQLLAAHLPPTRADATDWDAGDAADPYVVVSLRDIVLGVSSVATDTQDPIWNSTLPAVELHPRDVFKIEILDEDGVADESMITCEQDLAVIKNDTWDYWQNGVRFNYKCSVGALNQFWITFSLELVE
jgi:Ca2+-dependent lipid-binding protein